MKNIAVASVVFIFGVANTAFAGSLAAAATITCSNIYEMDHKYEVVVDLETNDLTLSVDNAELMSFSGNEVEKRLVNPGGGFPDHYREEVWITVPWNTISGLRLGLAPGREQGSLGILTNTSAVSFPIICP